LDRSKFDVYLYSASEAQDELTEQLKKSATEWCPIHDRSDSQAAQLIHEHAIHVLIDLAGYTDGNRLPVFAFKPAPVQATWLGFPFTTGLPEMDYVIGDPYALAPSYEKQFTEKPCRLPEIYLALQLKEETLKKRTPPKLAEHGIAFASFNNLLKMNDKVVNCWAQILHALPDASLTLKASQLADPWFRDQTTQRFRAHGIAPDRLTLMGYIQSHAEHLKSYGQIDIALDPFPYPGVTTSAEAIAMGVPVLSMRGHHFLSSTATSIAHHAGLDTWVADDVEDYVEKAVRFASDRQALLEFRTRLFNQAGHQPLFNVEKFAQDFGLALMQMWSERAA
jgi:predicted O-linked N-acetylglucosamine transferase (SPINDLY family)